MKSILRLMALMLLYGCSSEVTSRYIPQDNTYEVKYSYREYEFGPRATYTFLDKKSKELCPRGYEIVTTSSLPETDIVGVVTTDFWTIRCNK